MNIKQLFENYPQLNLKRICDTINIGYQYTLKLSKTPIKGETYDPMKINYAELDKLFERKQINLDNYDWQDITNKMKIYEPITPLDEFKIGVIFTLRNNNNGCEVVYLNKDENDNVIEIIFKDYDNNKCRVMSTDTFMHQSPRILSK